MKQLSVLALLLLGFASYGAVPPLVTVPEGNAPAIDGKPDPGEWKEAALLSGFFNVAAQNPATQQTEVRLLHDSRNLYLAVLLKDFALDPAGNMLAEFKANHKGRNVPVWLDESFEFRIAPPGMQNDSFYFGFNANGATHAIAPSGFDPDFDTRITLKTSRSDRGFWYAELVIPLNLFTRNGEAPVLTRPWRINFIRFQQRLEEKNSWAPLDGKKPDSHADFSHLGFLRFGTGEAVAIGPQELSGSDDRIRLHFHARANWDASICATMRDETGKQSIFSLGTRQQAGSDVWTLPHPAAGRKANFFQYRIACNGKVFYISPEIPVRQEGAVPELHLPEAVRSITMNGKKIPYASRIVLHPDRPASELEIESRNHPLKVRLIHSGIDWTGAWEAFDGTKWIPATSGKDSVSLPGANGAVRFRKKIWSASTRMATTNTHSRKDYPITAGDVWPLKWDAFSSRGWDRKKPLKKLKLHLFVPAGVRVTGASSRIRYPEGFPLYRFPPEQNQYRVLAKTDCRIGKELYQEYLIERTTPLLRINMFADHQDNRERCTIGISAETRLTGKELPVYYFAEAEDGILTEAPQKLTLNILPQLRGKQPEQARIVSFHWFDFNDISDPAENAGFMNLLRNAGINTPWLENRQVDPEKYGMTPISFFYYNNADTIHWMYGGIGLKAVTDRYPEARQKKGIRMVWLNRHPEADGLIDDAFRTAREHHPSHRIMCWDYETNPFKESGYVEFSDETLRIFAGKFSIGEKLTGETVLKKYRREWADFMCGEFAALAEKFHRMAQRHGFQFWVYSAYQSDEHKLRYGIDWNLLKNGKIDMAVMGYGRQEKLLRDSRAALGTTPHFYGILGGNRPDCRRATMIRRLADARGVGLLLWFQYGWSAVEMTEVAETTRLFSAFEPMFRGEAEKSSEVKISGTDPENLIVYRRNGKYLILLLNESRQTEFTAALTLPEGTFREFYSGKTYPGGQTHRFTVPAGKLAALFHDMP